MTPMTPTTLTTHRIAGALGAEVRGVDLAKPLDDDQFAELNQALREEPAMPIENVETIEPGERLSAEAA